MITGLRAASVADVPAIQHLEVNAGKKFDELGLTVISEDPPPDREQLLRAIANNEIFVVEDTTGDTAEDPVGEGDGESLLAWLWLITVDAAMHIEQITVATEHQGRGLGVALVNFTCEEAEKRGFTSVTLTTFVEVPWNGPWYQRRGFRYLDDDDLGPELRAIREFERLQGFDVSPRSAMILQLNDRWTPLR